VPLFVNVGVPSWEFGVVFQPRSNLPSDTQTILALTYSPDKTLHRRSPLISFSFRNYGRNQTYRIYLP